MNFFRVYVEYKEQYLLLFCMYFHQRLDICRPNELVSILKFINKCLENLIFELSKTI